MGADPQRCGFLEPWQRRSERPILRPAAAHAERARRPGLPLVSERSLWDLRRREWVVALAERGVDLRKPRRFYAELGRNASARLVDSIGLRFGTTGVGRGGTMIRFAGLPCCPNRGLTEILVGVRGRIALRNGRI